MKAAAVRSRSGSRAAATTIPRLEPRPMARALRVPLVEQEVRSRLAASALGLLLGRAEILSEGRRSESPTADLAFFGTTMITIHLDRLTDVVRDEMGADNTARLARLMSDDRRLLDRVRKLAHAEARRLDDSVVRVRTEVRVRAEGTTIYIDIDIESDGR